MFAPLKSVHTPAIQFSVRPLQEGDIDGLELILREHMRGQFTGQVVEAEVKSVLGYLHGEPDLEGRVRSYFVAVDSNDRVLGCMAFAFPEADMLQHFGINEADKMKSAELLNAFVTTEQFRGKGIGRRLFEQVCNGARDQGCMQLLVHSGPRYRDSWGFYDRVCDRNHGFIENKFGEGLDAKTWSKEL